MVEHLQPLVRHRIETKSFGNVSGNTANHLTELPPD